MDVADDLIQLLQRKGRRDLHRFFAEGEKAVVITRSVSETAELIVKGHAGEDNGVDVPGGDWL